MATASTKKPAAQTAAPKGKAKNVKAPKVKVEQVAEVVDPQSFVYPKLEVKICSQTGEPGESPITVAIAKELLGWESEADYYNRLKETDPSTQESACKYGEEYLLKDELGQKIRCWNNSKNRPFSETWSRQLAQDLLAKNWAGPVSMPGETVNGETIVIGRTGQVHSGQHRLIGLILAGQEWTANRIKYEDLWPEEPVLESIVVLGVSENTKILRTIDNVKPRSTSDVFYTSGIFDGLSSKERQECSRMLQAALTLVWNRTGLADKRYQTHSESIEFIDKHPSLLKAVKHIFEENRDRSFSILRLSPGQCAGMLYLMGTSNSDGKTYLEMENRAEKVLNLDYWDTASDFWVLLAKDTANEQSKAIREAIGGLVDEDSGTGGRAIEKVCIIARAWSYFANGSNFTASDIALTYYDDEGVTRLAPESLQGFGGIDLGPKPSRGEDSDPPAPSEEEIAQERERLRKERAAELAARLKAQREKSKG